MADEFPDPDEEFELMHADEMEMLDFDDIEDSCAPTAKRSLEFNSPQRCTKQKTVSHSQNLNDHIFTQHDDMPIPLDPDKAESVEFNHSEQPVNTENLINALDEVQSNQNKRGVDELFGDIGDIDFEDDRLTKKSRNEELTEEERQLLTIEAIVHERRRHQESKILPRISNTRSKLPKMDSSVLSRNVPRWNFMPLTDKKGERLYAKLQSEEWLESEISAIANHKHSGGLLSVPFKELEKQAHEQMQRKYEKIDKNKVLEQDNLVVKKPEEQLWVEKYKPKCYIELLSDESTNRALLQWLKLWDKVVFNRETKVKVKPKDAKGKGGFQKFQKKTGPTVNDELDEFGRPHHKVALLCGPPGLGKTTLAHMIAQQAGYNVVEVNASDDRSPEVFRNQLLAATQMKAVMGNERRPNCLVLDEIDGAPSPSIEVVLKFINGKTTSKGKSKKEGTGGSGILKRPIICICNDAYVPSLRPLRQVAFVVHFPPTASARLAARLCEVARLQSLKTDLGVMMALSEKTNNDIRACLSLLQGLTLGPGGAVRLGHVHSASMGLKDMQKGLFSVWQEIFQIQLPKRKTFVDTVNRDKDQQPSSSDGKISSDLSERVSSILKTVQGCGDYDRLALGVYENYLSMKIKDSSMVSVAQGLSWFCSYDLLSTKINTTQNYILYPYLAYPFAVWHLLFASMSWPKLTYPSTGYEMRTKTEKCRMLLDEMLKNMQPAVRCCTYREQLLLDTIPLLLKIIAPNFRPVSLALYSNKEKEELQHLIGIMIDYSLTYTQERSPEGNFVFNLDPNVEEVGRFEGTKGRSLSYASRQLLAREIELERLRRAEASLYRNADTITNSSDRHSQPAKTSSTTTPKDSKKMPLPNHLQRLTPKAMKKVDNLPVKDFFGRVVEKAKDPDLQKTGTDGIVKSDIWYHFKEGYNNAVRKNVTMADLIGNRS